MKKRIMKVDLENARYVREKWRGDREREMGLKKGHLNK